MRVFDGRGLTEPRTVVIDGAVIGTDETGAEVVDGAGAVLLPGLIDAHVHPEGRDALARLTAHGVTTGLVMTAAPSVLAALRDHPGLTDLRGTGWPVIGPGGLHVRMPGMAKHAVVHDQDHARRFVAERIADGDDYLKIMLEAPGEGGPPEEVARAAVDAAHAHGLTVVAHATAPGAYALALDLGVDVLTHLPLAVPVAEDHVARLVADGRVVIPTVDMMNRVAELRGVPDEAHAESVRRLHEAGVPILAGSDANASAGVPCQPPFGESLHRELELLVDAGLTTVAALHAATSLPAKHFGLSDRGAIQPGLRADLVLVDGDPVANISATRAISRVWLAGAEPGSTGHR